MATITAFRHALKGAKHVVILTGAGISAESGIPTFRGEGGLWRRYNAFDLATPEAFREDPSLVWQFYEYRRRVVRDCAPNAAHHAITKLQKDLEGRGDATKLTVVTQNIDGLHMLAGTRGVIEMHGSLWKVKPVGWRGFKTREGRVWVDTNVPIVPALTEEVCGKEFKADAAAVRVEDLPHHPDTGELLRPAVVWFGEGLDGDVIDEYSAALDTCDLLVIVGTSGTVYPAAGFSDIVQSRGGRVAEFNLEATPQSDRFDFAFEGRACDLLPDALDVSKT